MDSQVHCSNYNEFVSKTKSKKTNKQNNMIYNNNNFNKGRGPQPRGNYNKNYLQPNKGYNQQKPQAYPSWNVFNGGYSTKKDNFNQGFEAQQSHYAKGLKANYMKGSMSDKAGRSTNASDNDDGYCSTVFSELSGFRIMQNGRTIHNETKEEFNSSFDADSEFEEVAKERFASSEMTIGPNAKEISIPSFAMF